MAHVLATINLKGGVGKTHTTVALAEFYAVEFRKKVLVIDLDPQTNATVMLIGEDRWKALNQEGFTLARLFQDALDPENPKFVLEKALQKKVSDIAGTNRIDLLPSSLDLIDVQDRLSTIPSGRFYAINAIDILRRAIRSILDDYEVVLIDCPPNLGIITLNGLRISNSYIIPTIPDILSTYGIPQIVKRVKDFSQQIAEPIEPLGIVISKYRIQSTVHQNILKQLRTGRDAPVFKSVIKEDAQIAGAAEYVLNRRTLKQKYGYRGEFETYKDLAQEILQKLED